VSVIDEINLMEVKFASGGEVVIARLMDAIDDIDQHEAYKLMEGAKSGVVQRLAAARIIAIKMNEIMDAKKEATDA
jgi:hypothetical protein